MSRSVLLLDFDNVVTGLARLDYTAAVRFAQQPDVWVEALRRRHLTNGERRWLVLRCYMNPGGWLLDPTENSRIYYSRFRPFFTSAGFEVVDCPSLTRRSKNAADIKIVIDALDALHASVAFDEFVLGSTDADFTPLLQRLRAHDKRTLLMTSGEVAGSVRSNADCVIDEQEIMGLLEREPEAELVFAQPSALTTSEPVGLEQQFRDAVVAALEASTTAVNQATLSGHLRAELGIGQNNIGWPGGRGFTQAIRSLRLPGVELTQHHIYDSARHDPPFGDNEDLTPLERTLKLLTWPLLAPSTWQAVIDVLAEYAAVHEFDLAESTKWTRDVLAERGYPVGRTALGYLVRACRDGGADLRGRPTRQEIGCALLASLEQRAEDAGLDFSEGDRAILAEWFAGIESSLPARSASPLDRDLTPSLDP